jgi:hypothetical protein
MSTISEVLAKREAQVLAVTDEDRDEMDENNPVVFAESGPNRFTIMSMFFEDKVGGDNDGVRIEEDLGCGDILSITLPKRERSNSPRARSMTGL